MAGQNQVLQALGFVRKGKITLFPFRAEKLHGRSFSEYP